MIVKRIPSISVIISTYNSLAWLKKVLISYRCQSFQDFEIIIADDGSTDETAKFIHQFILLTSIPIVHVWQKDKGFRKCRILNKAILLAKADYIIMTDGDCLAREDFVETHYKRRKKRFFLSGGYFKLDIEISSLIEADDIIEQRCFDSQWLIDKGVKKTFKMNKLTSRGFKENFLNNFTTSKASWNGHNSSTWKEEILAINGFNEVMKYGGEDREFGERLMNNGVKSSQIRYSAICMHLEHERNYTNSDDLKLNESIRKKTKSKKTIWTSSGIAKSKMENTYSSLTTP